MNVGHRISSSAEPAWSGHESASGSARVSPASGSDVDILSFSETAVQPRLLLVEQDAAMRVLLIKMLSTDYQVEAVTDAFEACQAARLRPPDLIVIDIYFPGTDNLTLIRAVRAEASTAGMPIIILCVSLHKELLLRCLAAGASSFLLKPFNRAELFMRARVELQLRGKHGEASR